MRNIVIGAGHINIKYNSVIALRGSTGAPGEQEFTLRIANRLSEILRQKGFNIKQTDANANDDPTITKTDWDLALFIHYDANVYGIGGGFVDFPEPSTDSATAESQRIVKVIEEQYFPNAEITNVPARRNANTKYYYMWKYLTAKTPCAIIECGVGQDAHDKVILADTDRVCNAIARGICAAFSVNWDTPISPTSSTITNETKIPQIEDKQVKDIKEELLDLRALAIENKNQIKILGDKIIRGRQALE